MTRRLVAGAVLALAAAGAAAQTATVPGANAASAPRSASAAQVDSACPKAADVEPRQLIGTWRAEVEGAWNGSATVRLGPHPEYAESLFGDVDRDGQHAQVAADLEDGEFTLEESSDGVHIAATWLGDVVEGSCGREIRGSWEPAQGGKRGFVMRRVGP